MAYKLSDNENDCSYCRQLGFCRVHKRRKKRDPCFMVQTFSSLNNRTDARQANGDLYKTDIDQSLLESKTFDDVFKVNRVVPSSFQEGNEDDDDHYLALGTGYTTKLDLKPRHKSDFSSSKSDLTPHLPKENIFTGGKGSLFLQNMNINGGIQSRRSTLKVSRLVSRDGKFGNDVFKGTTPTAEQTRPEFLKYVAKRPQAYSLKYYLTAQLGSDSKRDNSANSQASNTPSRATSRAGAKRSSKPTPSETSKSPTRTTTNTTDTKTPKKRSISVENLHSFQTSKRDPDTTHTTSHQTHTSKLTPDIVTAANDIKSLTEEAELEDDDEASPENYLSSMIKHRASLFTSKTSVKFDANWPAEWDEDIMAIVDGSDYEVMARRVDASNSVIGSAINLNRRPVTSISRNRADEIVGYPSLSPVKVNGSRTKLRPPTADQFGALTPLNDSSRYDGKIGSGMTPSSVHGDGVGVTNDHWAGSRHHRLQHAATSGTPVKYERPTPLVRAEKNFASPTKSFSAYEESNKLGFERRGITSSRKSETKDNFTLREGQLFMFVGSFHHLYRYNLNTKHFGRVYLKGDSILNQLSLVKEMKGKRIRGVRHKLGHGHNALEKIEYFGVMNKCDPENSSFFIVNSKYVIVTAVKTGEYQAYKLSKVFSKLSSRAFAYDDSCKELYFIGGLDSTEREASSECHKINLTTGQIETLENMNCRRMDASLCIAPPDGKIKTSSDLYVYGGLIRNRNSEYCLNSFEKYDSLTKSWTLLRVSTPLGLYRAGITYCENKKLYILGGRAEKQKFKSVWSLDVVQEKLLPIERLRKPLCLKDRIFSHNGKIYALNWSNFGKSFLIYDIVQKKWSESEYFSKLFATNSNDLRAMFYIPSGDFLSGKEHTASELEDSGYHHSSSTDLNQTSDQGMMSRTDRQQTPNARTKAKNRKSNSTSPNVALLLDKDMMKKFKNPYNIMEDCMDARLPKNIAGIKPA
eukprot:CAMPEP_0114997068 /NCGR_PEP_ID=MMETSP0216-20121206/14686_1 /TAXON_ID=223996 /ORGANISM="Protocruzia adherens, Strain Boccale" /LENGTH=973 /DNA_ID=CAMNT_0002361393 /DNA_START=144 /DNA_END=3065 /DNA_ORIENTATION=+